jgi:hypothetical protein
VRVLSKTALMRSFLKRGRRLAPIKNPHADDPGGLLFHVV